MKPRLTQEQLKRLRKLNRLRENFNLFCSQCLKILTKQRETKPFVWNEAQKYVHKRVEQQRKENGGIVRALILKGRQQGISTYVAARFYRKASMFRGITVYILAHKDDAAKALFKIVSRYHKHNPVAPHVGKDNASEMEFDKLDSSYSVATAGEKAGGRSKTSTLFHGSEVAFWRNDTDHFAASVQTVPYEMGTEIILESTANGPQGEFYNLWQEAEAGDGDYIAIFVPWFWQPEYTREVSEDFELLEDGSDEHMSEIEYAETFGLSNEQMAWRRAKIKELRSVAMFDQEYPATAEMAFTTTNTENFIQALPVLRARKRQREGAGPLVLGIDPSGVGGDRFAICGRRGINVEFLEWRNNLETAEAIAWIKEVIERLKPDRIFIDAGGIGAAIVSLLRNDGDIDRSLIVAVNFGSPSQFKQKQKGSDKRADALPGPVNRRAEMYDRLKEWLEMEEGVSIPDLDVLQGDITATRTKPNLNNDLLLESKQEMRKRGVRSPDLADALVLTFASTSRITNYNKAPKKVDPLNPDTLTAVPRAGHRSGNYGWMA